MLLSCSHHVSIQSGQVELATYALVAFPVYFKRFMVDLIDQLALELVGSIIPEGVFDGIAKSLLRLNLADGSIAAF